MAVALTGAFSGVRMCWVEAGGCVVGLHWDTCQLGGLRQRGEDVLGHGSEEKLFGHKLHVA